MLNERVSGLLAEDMWRYALLGGVLSFSLTLVGYWQSGSELSLSPVFLLVFSQAILLSVTRAHDRASGTGSVPSVVCRGYCFW